MVLSLTVEVGQNVLVNICTSLVGTLSRVDDLLLEDSDDAVIPS